MHRTCGSTLSFLALCTLPHSTALRRSSPHVLEPSLQVMVDGEIVQAGQHKDLQHADTDFSLLVDAFFLPSHSLPCQVMRDGEIVQAGQYEELQRAGTDFSLLLDAHNDAMGSMDLPPPNPFQPSHTSHHHPQPQRAPSLGNILAANGDVFSRFDMDDQELATLLLGPQAGPDGLGLASGGGSGGMGGPGMGGGDGLGVGGGGPSGVAADGSLIGVVGGAGGVVVGPMAAVAAAVASGAEDRQFGRVNADVYRAYLTRAYGGSMVPIIVASQHPEGLCERMQKLSYPSVAPALATIFHPPSPHHPQVLFQVLQIGANWWLAREVQPLHPAVLTWPDVRAYASLAIGSGLFVVLRAFLSVHVGLRTADGFFQDMLHAVFRAPMAFFDSTPTGRTLARASADQNALDLQLFFNFGSVLNNLVQLLGIFLVTAAVTWPVIVVLIPLALLYVPLQRYYLSSSRELTRIDGLTKSPILAHFSETLAGAAVIRAFAQEERFEIENADAVDNNMRAYFHYYGAIYWLGLRLETISAVVLAFVAFLLVLVPQGTIEPGQAGVSLAYGLTLNMALVMTMWHLSNLENKLVAVDRIRHFSAIPSEAPLIVEGNRPSADWPNRGSISFENLQMRYREAMPLVLKGVTVTFRGGEKVGVVGRTGSGKSTLVVALFRLVEPVGGRVMIDGVDISTIGLQDLRSRLAIIPQDPTLFEGTVRSNLDPLGRYHSSLLWEVLEKCQLAEAVMDKEDKLDAIVVEGGENWSVGQRQLFCLARALLKRSRILVLDEATASVDSATDAIIQRTIKENFARATVITVAHRIPSVIDSDKVLVLEAGRVEEFDSPVRLLANKRSLFSQLAGDNMQMGVRYDSAGALCGNVKDPVCGNVKDPVCGNVKDPVCGNVKDPVCGDVGDPESLGNPVCVDVVTFESTQESLRDRVCADVGDPVCVESMGDMASNLPDGGDGTSLLKFLQNLVLEAVGSSSDTEGGRGSRVPAPTALDPMESRKRTWHAELSQRHPEGAVILGVDPDVLGAVAVLVVKPRREGRRERGVEDEGVKVVEGRGALEEAGEVAERALHAQSRSEAIQNGMMGEWEERPAAAAAAAAAAGEAAREAEGGGSGIGAVKVEGGREECERIWELGEEMEGWTRILLGRDGADGSEEERATLYGQIHDVPFELVSVGASNRKRHCAQAIAALLHQLPPAPGEFILFQPGLVTMKTAPRDSSRGTRGTAPRP
ncbi:unnamed protein product [Closterium sp. Yama58-4]|nr:unnamed protein product [Closterium sp. Yama58-4]